MTDEEMATMAYMMLKAALSDYNDRDSSDYRSLEAENRASKWSAILTALHVHDAHERAREASAGDEPMTSAITIDVTSPPPPEA